MAFREGFTIQYQSVRDKVMALVTNYYNKVFTEHHRTKPKKKGTVFLPKSMRYPWAPELGVTRWLNHLKDFQTTFDHLKS